MIYIGFRENSRNPGHCRISVFVGRKRGSRGHSGEIVLRTDEWDEIRESFAGGLFEFQEEGFTLDLMEPRSEAVDLAKTPEFGIEEARR